MRVTNGQPREPVWTVARTVAARTVAALLAWLALAAATAATLHAGIPNAARWRLLTDIGALWLLFALAAWLLLRAPSRAAVPLLIAGAIGLQALAVTATPQLTDDFYRYAWDGRVQSAHVDPYRYPPTAPELAGLRDTWLFPSGRPVLNHPDARTIYPPVAEAYFLAMHYLSPPGARQRPLQVGAAVLAVVTALLLLLVARRTGGDPRRAVLWAWCPAVVLEAGGNAHVDVLGALFSVAGLGALAASGGRSGRLASGRLASGRLASGRLVLAGALLGAAFAVKLIPALVAPAVLRGRLRAVGGAAAGLVAAVYLPHVLAVGWHVLGFLPGYLSEEGYGGTGRFALLRVLLPDVASPYAAVLVLGATAWLAWRRADAARPWHAALPMVGIAFLVLGPSYPWYGLLLVALVALEGRAEWLAVAAAAYPAYFAGPLHIRHEAMQTWAYGSALAVILAVSAWRRWARGSTQRSGLVPPGEFTANSRTQLDSGVGTRL